MSFPVSPNNFSFSSINISNTPIINNELTNEQKALVKDFFEEFKGREQEAVDFFNGLKAVVFVKHFPMTLLIGKDKSGLYHNTPMLQRVISKVAFLERVSIGVDVVCFSDPKVIGEELEKIKAKYLMS